MNTKSGYVLVCVGCDAEFDTFEAIEEAFAHQDRDENGKQKPCWGRAYIVDIEEVDK